MNPKLERNGIDLPGGGTLYACVMKFLPALLGLTGFLLLTSCATNPKKTLTADQLFDRADTNGDGRVSRAEYESFMIAQLFAQYDKSGDGFITEQEFVADGGTPEAFRAINTSGTGKISVEEARASQVVRRRIAQPFREADVNGNGSITRTEFHAARERSRAYTR